MVYLENKILTKIKGEIIMNKSDYRSIGVILLLFLCIALAIMYGIKKDKQKKEISTFTTKVNSLGYDESLIIDELSNTFIIKDIERQLHKTSDSIYLGNRICKKMSQNIEKQGITYILSRNNSSVFEIVISKEKINPQLTGKVLKIYAIRK